MNLAAVSRLNARSPMLFSKIIKFFMVAYYYIDLSQVLTDLFTVLWGKNQEANTCKPVKWLHKMAMNMYSRQLPLHSALPKMYIKQILAKLVCAAVYINTHTLILLQYAYLPWISFNVISGEKRNDWMFSLVITIANYFVFWILVFNTII